VEKRKRDGDKEEGEERKKVMRDQDVEVPSEEEVDEFFCYTEEDEGGGEVL